MHLYIIAWDGQGPNTVGWAKIIYITYWDSAACHVIRLERVTLAYFRCITMTTQDAILTYLDISIAAEPVSKVLELETKRRLLV